MSWFSPFPAQKSNTQHSRSQIKSNAQVQRHELSSRGQPGSLDTLSRNNSNHESSSTERDISASRVEYWQGKSVSRKIYDQLVEDKWRSDEMLQGSRETVESLTLANEQLESDLKIAQQAVFGMTRANAPSAEDDETIRTKLDKEIRAWRRFADRWAIQIGSDTGSKSWSTEDDSLRSLLAKYAIGTPESIVPVSKAGSVFLNMQLSHFLSKYIIEQPFLALMTPQDLTMSRSQRTFTQASALCEVYNNMKEDDLGAAHVWRSRTLSTLDPPYFIEDSSKLARRQKSLKKKQIYYQSLVEEFERSPAGGYLRTLSASEVENRRSELWGIISRLGDMFSALWTQKVDIQVRGLDVFQGQKYSAEDEYTEAHIDHRLEEGDTGMDGNRIQIAVSPAILAFGDEYGNQYDQDKVWAKAVVYILS